MNTDNYLDGNTIIYNDFCKNVVQCRYFKEWDIYANTAKCRSCTKVGESYDIEEYPKDCIFLTQIQELEEQCNKQIIWDKLKQ